MKRLLPIIIGIVVIFTLAFAFNLRSENASAAQASHLVISEVQVAGVAPTDDFVEIYNPTASEVDLADYRVIKVTADGTQDTNIVAFEEGDSIPAHGYFLWCNTGISVALACDKFTTGTVANNNSVGLRNGAINTGVLVDSVTFGTVTNPLGEGSSLTAPTASTSVERKANSASTALSMAIGGIDELMGNGEDTDNNSLDFVIRSLPQPQNLASAVEPISGSPTPTTQPSITPTPTTTPTNSPTPSASPTPTNIPTATPTNSPSPTSMPTATPTVNPTNTPMPTPTVTITPTPTPTSGKVIVQGPIFTCTINYRTWRIFHKTVLVPYLTCVKTSSN